MVEGASGENARRQLRCWLLVFGALIQLLACAQPERARSAQELAHLTRAIDAVRLAPNDRKRGPLRELRKMECQFFCELKNQCVAAYARHQQALDGVQRTKVELAQRKPEAAAQALAAASRELTAALELTTACAALQGETQRAFRRPQTPP